MPAVNVTACKTTGLDAAKVAQLAHDSVKNGIGKPDMYITVAVTMADCVMVGGKPASVLAQVDSIGGNFAGFIKVRAAHAARTQTAGDDHNTRNPTPNRARVRGVDHPNEQILPTPNPHLPVDSARACSRLASRRARTRVAFVARGRLSARGCSRWASRPGTSRRCASARRPRRFSFFLFMTQSPLSPPRRSSTRWE